MAPAWFVQPNLRPASGTGGTSSVAYPNSNPKAAKKQRASSRKGDPPQSGTPQAGTPQAGTPQAGTPQAGTPQAGPASDQGSVPAPHRWTFLTNHAHVLIALHANPDLVLREVAGRVGITERAVQRIVQDLEEEGFIRRQKVGRKNHYEVIPNKPLRHPLEAHRDIGDLLRLITG